MARRSKLIQHRGLECDTWAPLPQDEQKVQLYNSYWKKFGIESGELEISPLAKGEYIVVITDATLLEVEKKNGKVVLVDGAPKIVEGGSNGFYIDDPGLEPTLLVIYDVLKAAVRENHAVALPMDEMYDRKKDDDKRMTKRILRLEQLTNNQRRKVSELGLENKVGQPLALDEFERIFGDVKDKEFFCFPEHSTEGRVVLLQPFMDAVKNQHKISTYGAGKSSVRVIPFQKDGLYPLVPPDERGQNSNHWDRIFETWYAGRQGEEGRAERKVFVLGACTDYSVGLTAKWLKDTGYDVTVFAPGIKGLGITPKPVVLRELADAYAINVCYDWPKEFGKAPQNWDSMLRKLVEDDIKTFEGTAPGSWKLFVEAVSKYQAKR